MQAPLLSVLDYAGVATFAATGALMAAEKRQDILTFVFFAAITGVGGGTLRDVLTDAPVFWVQDPGYSIVCAAMAVLIWVTRGRGLPGNTLLWLDAVGLSVYAVVGAAKAMALGVSPVVCVVMGVITATFGGIIRDVLANEPSILLRRELYISAAIASAATFITLRVLGLTDAWAIAIAILLGFGVRAGAIMAHWHLPAFTPPEKKDRP
ncbi:MAG TPA: trimeric intracellular cation channel family protein [Hyphomonadaceae bacterium]|nr:trimeric intracellular cation channel family protein [Hyphomonadaceae bacterium]